MTYVGADPDVPDELGDERLRLVLLCSHPDLPPESAAALTLRLVMGVPTADIARLFLVSTPTMAARLTRARKRLAGASFAMHAGAALEARLAAVADVAYLAFTAGYSPGTGPDVLRADVAAEAIRLVRVVRGLARGDDLDALLALMLLQHSRRHARVVDGSLVLLPDQDRSRWRHDEAAEGLRLLTPLAGAPATPLLLQALIAGEHAIARRAEDTDWPRIVRHYDELLALTDTPVVRINRAVAVAEADGPVAGLAALDGLDAGALPGHRLPAVRAELLARAGRTDEARAAYDEALAVCANDAESAFLRRRRERLNLRRPPG
ncbi:MAG: subfamily polymerase sigma-24 subunit [Nocardioides sp.]|nr:subfamily polymerase sigma-24 subunit [Nocardioides sp.]